MPEPDEGLRTVLTVDDEPTCRDLVRAFLEPLYRVTEAATAGEALDVIARDRVDLVLLDVNLPWTSGLDVCRLIKSESSSGYLPVLLLTALGDQESRNRGLEAGADDFLPKPVDPRELLLRVRSFLRIREQDQVIRRQIDEMRRLDALKDDLVSFIIHDLRNPLSGVLGFLSLLREQLPDPLREDVEQALVSADELRGILDDIVSARAIEEGGIRLDREACSIGSVVNDAIRSVSAGAQARGIDLTARVAFDEELVLDRALLGRALENLIGTAIRHTPSGKSVEVRARAEGGGIAIEVTDAGPPIPDELKPGVFEKFGSIDARRKRIRRGQGMGLYFIQLVAQAHGGEVSARDREGGGAVFRIFLPRR